MAKETYHMAKETYHMAKKTYHMAKETYHMAKETYHMAKETYHMAKEIASPPSLLHLYAQSPLNPKPHTRRHTLARMAPREASILFSLFSLLSCAYYTLNPNPNP